MLAYQEEKQERFHGVFLCRLMLGLSQLNPSCRFNAQPPRKQPAHNHLALRFHDCSQAHTVYVSRAYVTQYNGRGWAYYFFFPLFVSWPERIRGIDVFTASQFPYPCCCAQIYRVKILVWPSVEVESSLSGDSFCLGKHTHRLLNYTKYLLMKRSIKERP